MPGNDEPLPDSHAERVEALLGACLAEGEAHLEEAVEKLCARHPTRAAAIREGLEVARSVGLHRSGRMDGRREATSGGAAFERIGPYQPLRELGRGGQGFVYLAEDTRLHRIVALKVLKGYGALSDKVIQRFRREAEVTSRLDHPGICGVYDAGVAAGIPYIAMRFVEGRTLADVIRTTRASAAPEPTDAEILDLETGAAPGMEELPPASPTTSGCTRSDILTLVGLVEKAARALHAAHEAGVVHRDIKPGNLMVTPTGEAVILDFGLASEEANELSLTQTGDLFGTPAYMSPEQLLAQRIRLDRRTDIYSLAVTLYECVTLRRPFEASTREALYQAIQYKTAVKARTLNRGVPLDLETILDKALEKDRDRRYATALDFAEDLRRMRESEPIRARRVSATGRLVRWAHRHPARAALVALLAVGIPSATALAGYAVAKAPEIRRGKELALRAEVERHLSTGYAQLADGDSKIAVASFDAALRLRPDSGDALAGKALALHQIGDPVASLRFLDAHEGTVDVDFAFTRLRYEAMCQLGQEPKAREIASRAPRDARTPLGWNVAGTIQMLGCDQQPDRKVFRDAVELFTRAALTTPHARTLYHFGLSHAAQHLGDAEPARQVHDALLELWPDSAEAAYSAGCAVSAFDPTAAVAAYERALELQPDHLKYLHNLVHSQVEKGTPAAAVAACRKLLTRFPDSADAHAELGYALRAEGKLDAAIAAFRRSLELKPDHRTYVKLGSALRDKGATDEAIAVLRKALELSPDGATAHFHLGLALAGKGLVDEAVAANRRSLALSPGSAETYVNLGNALRDKKDFAEAIASFRKAIELKPRLFQAHTGLGNVFLDTGRFEDAIRSFRTVIELVPNDPIAHTNLAVALRENGQIDDALAAYRKAIEVGPRDGDSWVGLGALLCTAKQDYDAAIEAFEQAILVQPGNVHAFRNLWIALERKGDPDVTIAVSRKMIERHPDHPEHCLYYALGAALARKGDAQGSVDVARMLVERRPQDAKARTNLGVALLQKGESEAGIAALREALAIDPADALAGRNLAIALRNQGAHDAAIEIWRKMAELNPDDAEPHHQIGVTLSSRGETDAAIAALRKAIEIDPRFVIAYYNLGLAYQAKGALDEAVAVYRRALELKPDFAEAHCNLSNCYADQGQLLLALASRRRGHELGVARADWSYPSAEWVAQIEAAVLHEAARTGTEGFAEDDAALRGDAAGLLEALVVGWRQDLDAGRRAEAIAAPVQALSEQKSWVALRARSRAEGLPEIERRRWRDLFATVDELARRVRGGK